MGSDRDDSIIVSFLPLLFLDCDFSYLKLIGLIHLQINLVSKHDALYAIENFKELALLLCSAGSRCAIHFFPLAFHIPMS